MKYILTQHVLGRTPRIEITQRQFEEYARAREILSGALDLEQSYDILVSGYLELEKYMLAVSAHNMVRRDYSYMTLYELLAGFNSKLMNFLTAVRLYQDKLSRDVKRSAPSSNKKQVKALMSKEYDANPNYRFMEALRNHAQHNGVPVHWVTQGMQRVSLGENDFILEFSSDMASQKQRLEADKKFKKSVLSEVEDKVDLKIAIRSYMESLSNVHHQVRGLTIQSVSTARELTEGALNQYKEASGKTPGLCALALSESGKETSSVPLLLDWDDIRIKLKDRNPRLVNLSKMYVSSKGKATKPK